MVNESGARITTGALPVALGRLPHFVELFQNLIGNAIKYSGGAPVNISIDAVPHGTEYVVRVRNNGIVIDPAYHEQIFGIFKRLHGREIPGTGIGLAICRKIVEGMHGRIWMESAPGAGSTFCFTVRPPLSLRAVPPRKPRAQDVRVSRKRISIVRSSFFGPIVRTGK